jgi:hypothetical protein
MIYGRLTECWYVEYNERRLLKYEAIGAAILTEVFALTAAEASAVAIAGVSYASIVGYTVTTAATIGLSYAAQAAFAGKPTSSVPPAENQVNIQQPIVSRRRILGEAKVGGVKAFADVDNGGDQVAIGTGDGATQSFWLQLLHNQGEIDSVREHWLADEQVLLDVNGMVSATGWATTYRSAAFIKNKLGGADQTAQEDLVAAFQPDFSAFHRWRGVANTLIRFRKPVDLASANKIFPYGPPDYRAVLRGSKVYDPRDGAQIADSDPDRPALGGWTWSDNAALVILDFHRHPDGFALRADREMVPISEYYLPDWIAFANLSDQLLTKKDGGTIKRYRLWGTYDLKAPPKATLDGMLLAAGDATLYRTGTGHIGIRGGKWTEPTLAIRSVDIRFHRMQRGSRANSSCNRVNAKYTSVQHDYQQPDMDPWIDQENIDLRRQELPIDLDLAWSPHHNQARRVAKIRHRKLNPAWHGTITVGPEGLAAFNEETIVVSIDELMISERNFLVTSWKPATNLATVEIGIAAAEASAYEFDPATEEGVAPAISAVTMEGSVLPQPENLVLTLTPTGTPGSISAVLSWENNSGLTLFPQVQYQDVTGGPVPAEEAFSMASLSDPAEGWVDIPVREGAQQSNPVILPTPGSYIFRVRFVSPTVKASLWVPIPTPGSLNPQSFRFNKERNSGYLPFL